MSTSFYVEPDHTDEPTLLAPTTEQLNQAAIIVRSMDDTYPGLPWADLPQGVRDVYLQRVRGVLAALTEVAAQ